MSWTRFMDAAPAADHAVQVYGDLDELAASVGRFVDAGVRGGEPALLIATAEHRPAFAAEVERRGRNPEELEEQGLLAWYDAEEALAACMDGDRPSAERFEQTVGRAVDELARRFPKRTIRAFGEMVDVLVRRGLDTAAIELEELGNELARTRRVAILCAYELDIFDLDAQRSVLPEVFRVHRHRRAAADPGKLAAAVDDALTDVVGRDAAARIYLRVAEEVPRSELPRAQAVLAWLSAREPVTARRVLGGARMRYATGV